MMSSLPENHLTTAADTRPAAIVIVDYGSQYTQLIARRVRALGCCSEVISPDQQPSHSHPHGFILSGSPNSTLAAAGCDLPAWLAATDKPLLGICYGMQLLVRSGGGIISSGSERAFGREAINLTLPDDPLFSDIPPQLAVWMSHSDHVSTLPSAWQATAVNQQGVVTALRHRHLPQWGVQFHPEVAHSEYGELLLANFCLRICQLKPRWTATHQLDQLCAQIKHTVGDGSVLVAVSGGVDSSVTAVLTARALGSERVCCVCIDNGLLRAGEAEHIINTLRQLGLHNVQLLDARADFLAALQGVTDAEEKRQRIGHEFVRQFEQFARGKGFTHLGQGTLYSDVIESGVGTHTERIKSHHNVGGLPAEMDFQLLEPLRFLFKDEVRNLGQELGIDPQILHRHPFPGPGLAVRIAGEVTAARLATLRAADAIYLAALHEHGLYDKIWQAFCVLLPLVSTGVRGDRRSRAATIILRAVNSVDAMTASVYPFPLEVLTAIANRITAQVEGVHRIAYDLSSKPPATIEWE